MQLIARSEQTMKELAATFAEFAPKEECEKFTNGVPHTHNLTSEAIGNCACGECSACENNLGRFRWLTATADEHHDGNDIGRMLQNLTRLYVEITPQITGTGEEEVPQPLGANYWAIVTTFKGTSATLRD